MKKLLFLILVNTWGIVSCAPVTTFEVPTHTLIPSNASTPLFTPQLTRTRLQSRTPAPSLTPSPSLTASLTSTAVPPLIVHKWRPESALIKMESGGGDGCCLYSYPPELVLYANGRIIINREYEENGEWRNQPITKVFSREELCSVLNTVDQTGFLYYDTNTYRPQNSDYFSIDGAGSVTITVNAWRSNFGEFFGLFSYLYLSSDTSNSESNILNQPGSPIIPPALRNVYYFLRSLSLNDVEIYQPQRLGLIVTRFDSAVIKSSAPIVDWPFDGISLSEIEKLTSEDNYPSQFFIVEGNIATSIYEHFGNSFDTYGENVRQDGQEFVVFLRPLLPYEIPQLQTYNILPDPSIKSPEFELECYPSDGVLPIPTSLTP